MVMHWKIQKETENLELLYCVIRCSNLVLPEAPHWSCTGKKKTEVFLEALAEKSDKDPEPDQIPSEVLRRCNAGFARLRCCLTPQIPASHPLSPCPATILYPSDGLDPDQDTAPHVFWGVYAELEQLPRFGKGNLHLHPGPRHLPLAHLASKEVLAKLGSKVVTWRQLQWLQSLNTHQKERTAIYKWQVQWQASWVPHPLISANIQEKSPWK